MKTILAPVDFSEVSKSVVREAAALARAFDGRVVLLSVVQPPVVLSEYAGLMDLAQITAAGEKNAARQLETLEDTLKSEFIKTESVQMTGAPVASIIEQAEKHDADFIVMGSHGHTAFYDLLVGSTTHGVLMRSKCPVVIVPAVKEGSRLRKKTKRAAAV
jgi:nucleotide-binding universal stress UspA family protein